MCAPRSRCEVSAGPLFLANTFKAFLKGPLPYPHIRAQRSRCEVGADPAAPLLRRRIPANLADLLRICPNPP